jgi:hypothetical protein
MAGNLSQKLKRETLLKSGGIPHRNGHWAHFRRDALENCQSKRDTTDAFIDGLRVLRASLVELMGCKARPELSVLSDWMCTEHCERLFASRHVRLASVV